jgi:hypothetical protein
VCFYEKTLGDSSETTKTAYAPLNNAHVLALDALPVTAGGSTRNSTHDVLATFDNGDVICLSANLDVVRWVANLRSLGTGRDTNIQLEYTSLDTAKSAIRGFLRGREDIAALLNTSSEDTADMLELTQVLYVIGCRSDKTITAGLYHIQTRSQDLVTTALSPIKHLVSWDLPKPVYSSVSTPAPQQYSLHAASGTLQVLSGRALLSYDFSGTVPELCSELDLPEAGVESFLRLSRDIVLTISSHACRLFDTKYNTLQAVYPLILNPTTLEAASPSKKRKLTQTESEEHKTHTTQLIAYHADHNLVVCLQGNEVLGMQLSVPLTRRGPVLLDAISKGITPQRPNEARKWQRRKAKLDRYASRGKLVKFEQAFAAQLGISLQSSTPQDEREDRMNGAPLMNGVSKEDLGDDATARDGINDEPSEDELRAWIMPETVPNDQRVNYRQYALYALSKIFCVVPTETSRGDSYGSLKVDFFPPNVFQWLVHTSHLRKEPICTELLRKALLDDAPGATLALSIADGDIVKALVEYDPDLHILSAVLNQRPGLPVGEVVQAIKLLMQSLDDQPQAEETTKLLTNGTTPSQDEMEIDIASELEAATYEIDHAQTVLDQGLLVRSYTLRPALIALQRFPPLVVSSTLRSMLPRRDLESLIRLLHLEMKNGGWTSPYDFLDLEHTSVAEDPDDNAVAIIASLLSCTLDAIGAGAWVANIGAPADTESSEDIIQSLHSDTSEALNGFWEARYMYGLLGEFLRFAENVPKSHLPSSKALEMRGKPFALSDIENELPMMPLGAKPDMGIERTKNAKRGKKVQRSKREIGMMISKRVPKYSFERIVI